MNTSQPVSSSIQAVDFDILTTEEIRNLSAKRITNPVALDNLLNPTKGGLHDPALGAFLDLPCATCLLDRKACPGHCGHIELPVYVYNCTFLDQAYRLLRGQCIHCQRFRLHRKTVCMYYCKLRLIRQGLLREAQEIDRIDDVKSGAQLFGALEDDGDNTSISSEADGSRNSGDLETKCRDYLNLCLRSKGPEGILALSQREVAEAAAEARRHAVVQFQRSIGVGLKRCQNCDAYTPKYRKDRATSIFRKPLNTKEAAHNRSLLKITFANPLEELNKLRRKQERKLRKKHESNGEAMIDEGVADMDSSSADDEETRVLGAGVEEPEPSSEEEDGEDVDSDAQDDSGMVMNESARPNAKKKAKKDKEEQVFVNANEVHASLVHLFDAEEEILSELYHTDGTRQGVKPAADMFFIQQLLVTPNKYRKEQKSGPEEISESPDNQLYRSILVTSQEIFQVIRELTHDQPNTTLRRQRTYDELKTAWLRLQDDVNSLLDSDKNPLRGQAASRKPAGIKQRLEKKEGLLRMNMMGKRVNFAARSVISPDPNIETNEIGVPPVFAKKLTYPEPVTQHSFEELKQAVINGPDTWPGAVAVEYENGQVVNLRRKNVVDRQAIANSLLAPSNPSMTGARNKKVHRHLNNGDIVIMNRQPTLHKPSMMAHRARVLPGEKTIRMHYANCNSYNADFDGDEMNMHFPQNEIARAEALQIADTDHQYLSTTAGEPLRGLIQDHISMGVWLTCQDSFFTREQYHELLYSALRPESNHITTDRIMLVEPMMMRPKEMWTGKQIVSTVLLNLKPKGYADLNMKSTSQIPANRWGPDSAERDVLVEKGQLLTGILDKKQLGPKSGGIVHTIYEAYGHTVAGKFLSIMGRLLTKLLHIRAFSCGVEDLILTQSGEHNRSETLSNAKTLGLVVATEYVSLGTENPNADDKEFGIRMESVLRDDEKHRGLDLQMGHNTAKLTSRITDACLPDGLMKPFPRNQMQAMTTSGAKGSQVNANLISCNLGQQVLEGRRVPVMISGKTLPSFRPLDPSIRAGGYVVDRFLTGIRPQEYFFHAMAGREGLIDTAVKTSRSGYLQRCLIKGMEGLRAGYDASVRDADGAVIQSLYGEDGLEITKQSAMRDFGFIASNYFSFLSSLNMAQDLPRLMTQEAEEAREHNKRAEKAVRRTGNIDAMDPAISVYPPANVVGSTSESFYQAAKQYMDENPHKLIRDKKRGSEKQKRDDDKLSRKQLERILDFNYMRAVVQPGEAVGVVAAQSIGEPSTQMTLNTFHLAGHSAKNVTLGIPRLRELLMTASRNPLLPTMDLRFISEISLEDRKKFAKGISRRSVAEVIDEASVEEEVGPGLWPDSRKYNIRLSLYPSAEYTSAYTITVADVAHTLETKLLFYMNRAINNELKKHKIDKSSNKVSKSDARPEIGESAGRVREEPARPEENVEGGDSDADDDGDDDAATARRRTNLDEGMGYEDPDEDEEAVVEAGEKDASPGSSDDEDDDEQSTSPRQRPENEDEAAQNDEAAAKTATSSSQSKPSSAADKERENRIKDKYRPVTSFHFNDESTADICSITLEYPTTAPKLLMLPIVKRAAQQALIQEIPGISSAALITPEKSEKDSEPYVTTAGANLKAMWDVTHQSVINPHRIYSNSVWSMLECYGVEAARGTLIRELQAVFEGHSISVDARHLTLIADYMTRSGGYLAFNRHDMTSKTSTFAKMSFETTVGFLRDAVMMEGRGQTEELRGPSARIAVGRIGDAGTGSFDVLLPLEAEKEKDGDSVMSM